MKKHIFAALAFHGLDRPLLAFADLYWPYLALIEFFGQFEVFLVKKYIEMNHFHYSNIKSNFQTKFWTLGQCAKLSGPTNDFVVIVVVAYHFEKF